MWRWTLLDGKSSQYASSWSQSKTKKRRVKCWDIHLWQVWNVQLQDFWYSCSGMKFCVKSWLTKVLIINTGFTAFPAFPSYVAGIDSKWPSYQIISWFHDQNSCNLDLSIVIFSTVPWEKAVFNKESDAFLERNMSFGWKECLLALVKKLEDPFLNVNGVDRNWEILSETNFFQLRLRLRLYRVIKANCLNSHSLRSPICVSCEVTIDEFVENCGYGSSHSLLALIRWCPDL